MPAQYDFTFLDVAKGKVFGHETGSILGFNPNVGISSDETVWTQGGEYTYLSANTELFMSSTNINDVNIVLLVKGLTDDYAHKQVRVTFTSGQAQQSISEFFRIHEITVVGGSEPQGDLYCASTGGVTGGVPDDIVSIKAKIDIGLGTTQLGLYTVPKHHTMYLVRVTNHTRKNKDAVSKVVVRPKGAPGFILATQFPSYQNSFQIVLEPPFVVRAESDFELRASTTANQTEVVVSVGYILVDNSKQ